MSKHHNQYEDFDDDFEYEDDEEESKIDWGGIFRKLLARRWLFIISTGITLLITIPFILTIPKFYTVTVKLAPELSSGSSTSVKSGLSSLLSSIGMGSSAGGSDAIGPLLYPDLMNSSAFLVSLFDIPVVSMDGQVDTTYYTYLLKYQKKSALSSAIGGVMSLFPKHESENQNKKLADNVVKRANYLNKKQTRVATLIMHNVVCDVDKKTGVITITVKDQDPFICATVADSACQRLQEFITEYRSKKAKKEMLNVEKQYKQAKADYEESKQRVESFNDSNWDLVDEDLIVQQQDLQNKMQIAFQVMSTFNNQLMVARSKYESSLPVYTVLDGAVVPLRPSGPNRKFMLLFILIFVLGIETAIILIKDKVKQRAVQTTEDTQDEANVPT